MSSIQSQFREARAQRGDKLDYNRWLERRGFRLYQNIENGVPLLHLHGMGRALAKAPRWKPSETLDVVDRLLGEISGLADG